MRAYERLLKYVSYSTGSNPEATEVPSNPDEFIFARDLAAEMETLGFVDVHVDEHCYIRGTIPANIENYDGPVLGLIAHIDVSSAAAYTDIKPQVIHYTGGDLVQDAEKGYMVSRDDYPFLARYEGMDIVTSDGTTLLGADDKAGVSEIMTLAEQLQGDPAIKHGTIEVCFTPDEEIGRGSDFFDIDGFNADVAYTVDGEAFGEVQGETFNALSATVRINGFSIHPGSAKNMMKNACRIACEFDGLIPDSETPEHTEGYEGFYHLIEMKGDVERMDLDYIIRDHDFALAQSRAEHMHRIAEFLNSKYGDGTVEVDIEESYRNMIEIINEHPRLLELPIEILKEMDVEADTSPIRGGTDGATLSFKGLPCPNIGVGGHNFHGRKEFAVVQSMDSVVELLIRLVQAIAKEPKTL